MGSKRLSEFEGMKDPPEIVGFGSLLEARSDPRSIRAVTYVTMEGNGLS